VPPRPSRRILAVRAGPGPIGGGPCGWVRTGSRPRRFSAWGRPYPAFWPSTNVRALHTPAGKRFFCFPVPRPVTPPSVVVGRPPAAPAGPRRASLGGPGGRGPVWGCRSAGQNAAGLSPRGLVVGVDEGRWGGSPGCFGVHGSVLRGGGASSSRTGGAFESWRIGGVPPARINSPDARAEFSQFIRSPDHQCALLKSEAGADRGGSVFFRGAKTNKVGTGHKNQGPPWGEARKFRGNFTPTVDHVRRAQRTVYDLQDKTVKQRALGCPMNLTGRPAFPPAQGGAGGVFAILFAGLIFTRLARRPRVC